MDISGLVRVDKPAGWTSFDVVNKIRGLLEADIRDKTGLRKRLKVGHSGTLDPFATGLLLVAFGSCTKQLHKLLKSDKTYLATVTLGVVSSTGDLEGELTKQPKTRIPTETLVSQTLKKKFTGTLEQTPPSFSAIKIGGKKAYELARRGIKPELSPREVTIHSLRLVAYKWPLLKLDATVSSGTYIRVLAEDIGQSLGVGAYLSELRRTEVAGYQLEGALQMEHLSAAKILEAREDC